MVKSRNSLLFIVAAALIAVALLVVFAYLICPIFSQCIITIFVASFSFILTEGWFTHNFNEFENRFWSSIAFCFACSCVLASDSPIRLSKWGVSSWSGHFFIIILFTYLVHLFDRDLRRRVLKNVPNVLRRIASSTEIRSDDTRPVGLLRRNVERIDQKWLSSTFMNVFMLPYVLRIEHDIISLFSNADTVDLNLMLERAELARVFYKIKDHKWAKKYNRTKLLDLLTERRLGELTVVAKVHLLDGLQRLKLAANPKSEVYVQRIIKSERGDRLSELKSLTDSKGDINTMHNLLFARETGVRSQIIVEDILKYIAHQANVQNSLQGSLGRQRNRLAWRKILSDIDDTLLCSGGSYPAGCDQSFPKHELYPGVLAFYRELDIGAVGDDSWDERKHQLGNLVFLSARPHVYKNLLEASAFQKFQTMREKKGMHSTPSILTGSLDTGADYIINKKMEPLAAKKFQNFVEYFHIYPEYKCIFIGDNGQGDVRMAEMVNSSDDEAIRGVLQRSYIHVVIPLHETHTVREETRQPHRCKSICYFRTYVDAAIDALEHRLIHIHALRRIMVEAVQNFESIPEAKWKVQKDEVASNVRATAVAATVVSGSSSAVVGTSHRAVTGARRQLEGAFVGYESKRDARLRELNQALIRANTILENHNLAAVKLLRFTPKYMPGTPVQTRYGKGVVTSFRRADGVYEVLLPWDSSGDCPPVKAFLQRSAITALASPAGFNTQATVFSSFSWAAAKAPVIRSVAFNPPSVQGVSSRVRSNSGMRSVASGGSTGGSVGGSGTITPVSYSTPMALSSGSTKFVPGSIFSAAEATGAVAGAGAVGGVGVAGRPEGASCPSPSPYLALSPPRGVLTSIAESRLECDTEPSTPLPSSLSRPHTPPLTPSTIATTATLSETTAATATTAAPTTGTITASTAVGANANSNFADVSGGGTIGPHDDAYQVSDNESSAGRCLSGASMAAPLLHGQAPYTSAPSSPSHQETPSRPRHHYMPLSNTRGPFASLSPAASHRLLSLTGVGPRVSSLSGVTTSSTAAIERERLRLQAVRGALVWTPFGVGMLLNHRPVNDMLTIVLPFGKAATAQGKAAKAVEAGVAATLYIRRDQVVQLTDPSLTLSYERLLSRQKQLLQDEENVVHQAVRQSLLQSQAAVHQQSQSTRNITAGGSVAGLVVPPTGNLIHSLQSNTAPMSTEALRTRTTSDSSADGGECSTPGSVKSAKGAGGGGMFSWIGWPSGSKAADFTSVTGASTASDATTGTDATTVADATTVIDAATVAGATSVTDAKTVIDASSIPLQQSSSIRDDIHCYNVSTQSPNDSLLPDPCNAHKATHSGTYRLSFDDGSVRPRAESLANSPDGPHSLVTESLANSPDGPHSLVTESLSNSHEDPHSLVTMLEITVNDSGVRCKTIRMAGSYHASFSLHRRGSCEEDGSGVEDVLVVTSGAGCVTRLIEFLGAAVSTPYGIGAISGFLFRWYAYPGTGFMTNSDSKTSSSSGSGYRPMRCNGGSDVIGADGCGDSSSDGRDKTIPSDTYGCGGSIKDSTVHIDSINDRSPSSCKLHHSEEEVEEGIVALADSVVIDTAVHQDGDVTERGVNNQVPQLAQSQEQTKYLHSGHEVELFQPMSGADTSAFEAVKISASSSHVNIGGLVVSVVVAIKSDSHGGSMIAYLDTMCIELVSTALKREVSFSKEVQELGQLLVSTSY